MKNLIVAAALCITSILFSQESINNNLGILNFESETIDYGTLPQNANGKRTFVFKNTGNQPIVITKVKGSCGCTVATKPNKPILPNETAEIGVSYATNRIGAFSKTITISSNASVKNKTLHIKGVIKKVIQKTVASIH